MFFYYGVLFYIFIRNLGYKGKCLKCFVIFLKIVIVDDYMYVCLYR